MLKIIFFLLGFYNIVLAKEIALTFDDAPIGDSQFFTTSQRTEILIKKLKILNVPQVIIFANPCRENAIVELQKFKNAGHLIGNHTCSHVNFDKIGFEKFSKDAKDADEKLSPLMTNEKYFRFPFLREGSNLSDRDKMHEWLTKNHYKNGYVSVDDDDYLYSFKMNQAKKQGKVVDLKKVEELFLANVLGGIEYADNLAREVLGRSPKHVLLLHEMDATVMFLDKLVLQLRKNGWTVIKTIEAYKDPIYSEIPKSLYAGDGLIAQLKYEKSGKKQGYQRYNKAEETLNRALNLK